MKKKTIKNEVVATKKPNGRPIEWTEDKIEGYRLKLEEWMDNEDNYYFEDYLNQNNLHAQHLQIFSDRSSKFLETLTRARRTQESRIVHGTMSRKFDATFAKFLLANKAGWKEKTELSGDSKNPLSFVLGAIDGQTKDILVDAEMIDDKE